MKDVGYILFTPYFIIYFLNKATTAAQRMCVSLSVKKDSSWNRFPNKDLPVSYIFILV